MTWLLLLVMLQGRVYAWPEPFADKAACEREGNAIMVGQGEVAIVESVACIPARERVAMGGKGEQ
jgi:hypothetical protein